MKLDDTIRAVQQALGIDVDGNAGPQTWEAIYNRIRRLRMTRERLEKAFFVGGIIAGIGTPVAILIAFWGLRAQLQSSVIAEESKWTLEVDKVFIDHPEFQPYFERNQPISNNDASCLRVAAVADFMMDGMETILETETGGVNKGWESWIYDSFANSPILRERLCQNPTWYPELYSKFQNWKKAPKQKAGAVPD